MGPKGKRLFFAFTVIAFLVAISVRIMEKIGLLISEISFMIYIVVILPVILLWTYVYWRKADIIEKKNT
jgi:hypothetical protein